jgi:hypothetical protein
MKAILVFDLPEEESLFRQMLHGPNAHEALGDIRRWVRSAIKYEGKATLSADETWTTIHEILSQAGLYDEDVA